VKTEGQVKQKVKQVVFRHRKEYVRRGLAQIPDNCGHNRVVHLPQHTGNRATIRVCGLENNDVVCDASMGGDAQARGCPHFKCQNTSNSLKTQFNIQLGLNGETVEIGYIAKEYPDVAALMWVMGPDKNANREEPEEEEDPQGNILAFFGDAEEPENLPDRPLVEDLEVDGDV